MIRQNRIKTVLTLAVVATAVFAGPAQAGPLEGELGILTPGTLSGINPATGAPWAAGDSYRFAFFTSAKTTAESADIETYNTWVQNLANASTVYDIGIDEGVTWKVIGSTDAVDARDNTLTNPTVDGSGHAIFLLDGSTVVANDYADLWDGEIQHIIDLTEQGTVLTHWPFTGTRLDGTATAGFHGPLGNTGNESSQGRSDLTTEWIWRVNTAAPKADPLNMYALSDPLVIVGQTDPNVPDVDAGADMITWSGEPVTLDPNVVEKEGSDWTALTYLWSADPNDGVEFSNPNIKAPTVTITKATDDPSPVTITLAVNNAGYPPEATVTDSMTIDVYDTACEAAKAAGLAAIDPTDLDENCITAFPDFAVMATTWLDDYTLIAPEPK